MRRDQKDAQPETHQVVQIPRIDAIYRAHYAFVWSNLVRMGVAAHAAEDACQDVFMAAHRRLPEFEGRSTVRTWLFGILRRIAFRYRRTADRTQRRVHALAAESVTTVTLDDVLDVRRRCALVLRALDDLDDGKRAVVVLYLFEGLSGPQVAETLGITLDTVYARVKAGRRQLVHRLAPTSPNVLTAAMRAAQDGTKPSKGSRRRVAAALVIKLGAGPVAATTAAWKTIVGTAAVAVVGAVGLHAAVAQSGPAAGADHDGLRASGVAATEAGGHATKPPIPVATNPTQLDQLRRQPSSRLEAPPPTSLRTPTARPTRPARPTTTAALAQTGGVPRANRGSQTSRGLQTVPQPDPISQTNQPDRLSAEVALIGEARIALDGGRPSVALRMLQDHAHRFPGGQLEAERRAYQAIALCESGRTARGRVEGRLFVRRNPDATLAARVRAACDLGEIKPPQP